MEINLAVLIDFENIAAGTEKEGLGKFDVNSLMQRVKDKGRILVARSYADWGRFSRFKQTLLTNNVTMMELTSHGMQDKNRADIAMVVDALEMAFTRDYIDTYVVVSGDSDFTPMVLKMRELNKRVIGIGTRKSTSRLLIQACDEFIFYDSIVSSKKQPSRRRKKSGRSGGSQKALDSAYDLLEAALRGLQREIPDPPLASVVKSAMMRKSPDFNEGDLGFSTFGRFLEAAEKAGVIKVSRDSKSGGYRVDSVDDDGKASNGDAEPSRSGGEWEDEYLPDAAGEIADTLGKAGLPVLGAPTRLAVLEALVEVVKERKRRRRKTTVQFVSDDIRKKLRNTHPDIPKGFLKGVLDGLMQAGELIHRDGTAIRSPSASFKLVKDAEGLNEALVQEYLGALQDAGIDLGDTKLLAELFLGNRDRTRDIETAIAWQLTEADREEEADLNDVDLDDLLVPGDAAKDSDDDDDDDDDEEKAEAKPAKKRSRSRSKKKSDDEEASSEADEDEEEKPKKTSSKRKSSAKKKAEEPPAEEAPAEEAEAEAEVEEKPKKKSSSRSRSTKSTSKKKTTSKAKKTSDDDDDDEKPKRKPRRRTKKENDAKKAAEAESPVEGAVEPQPGPEVVAE